MEGYPLFGMKATECEALATSWGFLLDPTTISTVTLLAPLRELPPALIAFEEFIVRLFLPALLTKLCIKLSDTHRTALFLSINLVL